MILIIDDNTQFNEVNFIFFILKVIFIIISIYLISKIETNAYGVKEQKILMQNETDIVNNLILERNQREIKDYQNFLNLKDKPGNPLDPLVINEKNDILKKFSENIGEELGAGMEIVFNMNFNFGNQIISLNKLIFYCEIIGCKKIILDKNNGLYINHNIKDKKYNLKIEVVENDMVFNGYGITDLDPDFYNTIFNLKIENRFNIFKKEILKNLPKVKTNKNDLYIHIRGGDIFKNRNPSFAPDYAQPPLCFYRKVINNNNFRKIIIISEDTENPVINKLIKENNNIIYKPHSKKKDIAYLAYAYNIIGSISSFLISIIKLNNKLKYFWEYNIYLTSLKVPHMHHSIYNFTRNYTIFRMEPSEKYKNEMIIWEDSDDQLNFMINETCTNDFTIIKPNI